MSTALNLPATNLSAFSGAYSVELHETLAACMLGNSMMTGQTGVQSPSFS